MVIDPLRLLALGCYGTNSHRLSNYVIIIIIIIIIYLFFLNRRSHLLIDEVNIQKTIGCFLSQILCNCVLKSEVIKLILICCSTVDPADPIIFAQMPFYLHNLRETTDFVTTIKVLKEK